MSLSISCCCLLCIVPSVYLTCRANCVQVQKAALFPSGQSTTFVFGFPQDGNDDGGTGGGDVPGATGRGALSVASLVAASLGGGGAGDGDAGGAENSEAAKRSNPLAGARRRLDRLTSDAVTPAAAPLPKTISERLERKAAYRATGESVSLWQDTVKANRERPTLKFTDAEREKAPRVKTLASMNAGFDAGGDGATAFEMLSSHLHRRPQHRPRWTSSAQ